MNEIGHVHFPPKQASYILRLLNEYERARSALDSAFTAAVLQHDVDLNEVDPKLFSDGTGAHLFPRTVETPSGMNQIPESTANISEEDSADVTS